MLSRVSKLLGYEPSSLNAHPPDGRPPVKVPVLSGDEQRAVGNELFKQKVLALLAQNKASQAPPPASLPPASSK